MTKATKATSASSATRTLLLLWRDFTGRSVDETPIWLTYV